MPVQRDENVLCTITNTAKGRGEARLKPLVPLLECVLFRGAAPDSRVLGLSQRHGPHDSGPDRRCEPLRARASRPRPAGRVSSRAADRRLPDPVPGRRRPARLDAAGQTVTASMTSARCTPTSSSARSRPGRRPRHVPPADERTSVVSGGNGTTTGPSGRDRRGHRQRDGGPGTNLADYDSRVECTRNGVVDVSVAGHEGRRRGRRRRPRRLHLHEHAGRGRRSPSEPAHPAPTRPPSPTHPADHTAAPDAAADRPAERCSTSP